RVRRMPPIDPTFQLPGTPLLLGDLFALDATQHKVVGAVAEIVRGVPCLAVTIDPKKDPGHPPGRRTLSLAADGPREGLPMLVREFDTNRTTPFRTVEYDGWQSLDGAGGAWLPRQQVITDPQSPATSLSLSVTRATLGGLVPTDFTVSRLPF